MEFLTVQEIAKNLGTSVTFVRHIIYEKNGAVNEKVQSAAGKWFSYKDVIALIQAEAEKKK